MEENKKPATTGRLNAEQNLSFIIPVFGQFGTRRPTFAKVDFHPVPSNYKSLDNPFPWRIVLRFGAPAPTASIGFEIYGDVSIGRGSDGPHKPDIDTSNLNAQKLGVSRRHALLRPTPNKLFLIDLQSTNGSFVNAIPIGKGMAQSLKTGDMISIAGLSCEIEVVSQPNRPYSYPEEMRANQPDPALDKPIPPRPTKAVREKESTMTVSREEIQKHMEESVKNRDSEE